MNDKKIIGVERINPKSRKPTKKRLIKHDLSKSSNAVVKSLKEHMENAYNLSHMEFEVKQAARYLKINNLPSVSRVVITRAAEIIPKVGTSFDQDDLDGYKLHDALQLISNATEDEIEALENFFTDFEKAKKRLNMQHDDPLVLAAKIVYCDELIKEKIQENINFSLQQAFEIGRYSTLLYNYIPQRRSQQKKAKKKRENEMHEILTEIIVRRDSPHKATGLDIWNELVTELNESDFIYFSEETRTNANQKMTWKIKYQVRPESSQIELNYKRFTKKISEIRAEIKEKSKLKAENKKKLSDSHG